MTNDETGRIGDLTSSSPSQRATIAGWLVRHPHEISSRELMRALQEENVPQIRKILLQILAARQSPTVPNTHPASGYMAESSSQPSITEQIDVAALIRHELSPPVGWIRAAADVEIQDFGSSKTNEAVRKLQRRIDGLVAMIKSGEDLNLQRFSLPYLLIENWPDSRTPPNLTSPIESANVEIETDEGLFALLVSNAFQNAIDASLEATGKPRVEINWGFTDQNYWVRITNPFSGEQLSLSEVAGVGSSSKMAHQGQGMALIQRVAKRLGIAVGLEGHSGTASFTMSGTLPNG